MELKEKKCNKCSCIKPLKDFNKVKSGFRSWCKHCRLIERKAAYRKRNAAKINEAAKLYYSKNKDRVLAYAREWKRSNPEWEKEYKKSNRDIYNKIKRRYMAKAKLSVPDFIVREAIKQSMRTTMDVVRDLPYSLIETKRSLIKLKRKIQGHDKK